MGLIREACRVCVISYDNGIKVIAPGAFSGMSSLIGLHLQNNDIAVLPEGALSGLTAVDRLELER